MTSHATLLHPTWDANHPLIRCIHAVYGTLLSVTQQPDLLTDKLSEAGRTGGEEREEEREREGQASGHVTL